MDKCNAFWRNSERACRISGILKLNEYHDAESKVIVSDDYPMILVADDDWMNREVMEAMFEMAGYRVVSAHSGAQAVRMAQELQPLLALVDVRMPDADGYGVCAQIKSDARTEHIKVMLITALERDGDRDRAHSVNADAFVLKTLDWGAILAEVKQLIV